MTDEPVETTFGITFDCTDARAQARFWALALGYVEAPPPQGWASWEAFLTDYDVPEEEWNDGASLIPATGSGPSVGFLRVPEAKTVKNRLHLDLKVSGGRHVDHSLRVARFRAKQEELTGAGASLLRENLVDGRLDGLVMLDPEGNEFCIV